MSLSLERMKRHVDEGMDYVKEHGLKEPHLKQIRLSAVFGQAVKWVADSIQSKVRGTKEGAKKHIKEIDSKIGFQTLLIKDISNLFIDFKTIVLSIDKKLAAIKDGWTRTTKLISLLIAILFWIRDNKTKIIKLSGEPLYNKLEEFLIGLFYILGEKSKGRIFKFKDDSDKFESDEQLDSVFISILKNTTSYKKFKELGKHTNQVYYFKQQVTEYYSWINKNSEHILNGEVIKNIKNLINNIINCHVVVLYESLSNDAVLDGQDYVETNDYAQSFLADGELEIVYVKTKSKEEKSKFLDNVKVKKVWAKYIDDLSWFLQTCGIEVTPQNFYHWLQYSNLSNKITNKRQQSESFDKLIDDFTSQVILTGDSNDKDFSDSLRTNLENNLTYLTDFKNIKEFILSKEGIHDVFIPFILRIQKVNEWDKLNKRLIKFLSLLNYTVVRGNLWNSFSKVQISIITDDEFDKNPFETLIKHLITDYPLSDVLVRATHKDVLGTNNRKHHRDFDRVVDSILRGTPLKAVTHLDTVNLRPGVSIEQLEHIGSQNPENGEPIKNVDVAQNLCWVPEDLNKNLSNKLINEKKNYLRTNQQFENYSLKALLPLFGWDEVSKTVTNKKYHDLMKKHFNSTFEPIDSDEDWDDYIESKNPNKEMYGELFTDMFLEENFKKLMKTGLK